MPKRALIFVSGGLDSLVALAQAKEQGRDCLAISFQYGQRHEQELSCAKNICEHYKVPHKTIVLELDALHQTALSKYSSTSITKNRSLEEIDQGGKPSSYVPARNTLFFAYAMAIAEVENIDEVIHAPHKDDHIYPDCTPSYIAAQRALWKTALDHPVSILTPFIEWSKIDIVQEGARLNVPFALSLSCYDPPLENSTHCGLCDSCLIRKDAFKQACIKDPTDYQK